MRLTLWSGAVETGSVGGHARDQCLPLLDGLPTVYSRSLHQLHARTHVRPFVILSRLQFVALTANSRCPALPISLCEPTRSATVRLLPIYTVAVPLTQLLPASRSPLPHVVKFFQLTSPRVVTNGCRARMPISRLPLRVWTSTPHALLKASPTTLHNSAG